MTERQGVHVVVRWGGASAGAVCSAEAGETVLRWMPLALSGCEVELRSAPEGSPYGRRWEDGVELMDCLVQELSKASSGKGS